MALLPRGFDASAIPLYDIIPEGRYLATIIASSMRPTRAGQGEYLELTFQISAGDYRGRKLWVRLNLENPNALVVRIAKHELAAICRAVDVLQPSDSSDLHGRPLYITVRHVQEYEMTRCRIRGYAPVNQPPTLAAPADQRPTLAAPAAQPPWKHK